PTLPFFIAAFLLTRPPPRSSLFPYTTLFRSSGTAPLLAHCTSSSITWLRLDCQPEVVSLRRPHRLRRCAVPADDAPRPWAGNRRSEEHTSELQSRENLVCRLLLEKKKQKRNE